MKNRMCFYLDSAAQENTPAPEVRPFIIFFFIKLDFI